MPRIPKGLMTPEIKALCREHEIKCCQKYECEPGGEPGFPRKYCKARTFIGWTYAGKGTCIYRADGGSIELKGEPIDKRPSSRRRVSGTEEEDGREGVNITVNRAWMESLLELAMAYIEEHGERDKNGEFTCRFPDDPGGGRHSGACDILRGRAL